MTRSLYLLVAVACLPRRRRRATTAAGRPRLPLAAQPAPARGRDSRLDSAAISRRSRMTRRRRPRPPRRHRTVITISTLGLVLLAVLLIICCPDSPVPLGMGAQPARG